ncbi:MAG: protein phosphatase 2C domain-containing protein, partial [Blastocatellia bacterium]
PHSERMKRAAETANESIWNQAQSNPSLTGMGATLTAVLVEGTSALIAQVGDSRAYMIRGDQIKQVTKDQSLIQLLMESGAIKPDQASSVPQNVIMQALGTSPIVQVAITSVQLYRNDYLLLCSDGLSNKVQTEEMKQVVQLSPDLAAGCRKLVEMANERGGEDNITVIIARFDGESLYSAAESSNNTITGSFEVLSEFSLSESHLEASNQFHGIGKPPEQIQPTTLVLSAIPETPEQPPVAVAAELPSQAQANVQQRASDSSKTWTIIVLALLLLLLAAGMFFGYQYLKRRRAGPPRDVTPSQTATLIAPDRPATS